MYCLNDPKPIMLSKTLKLVEEKIIASEDFFRTHQSHLINLRHLKTKSIQNNFVTLTDGSKIPVARSRKSILEDYFLEKKNS
jgi:two-component system LytT family response regulator